MNENLDPHDTAAADEPAEVKRSPGLQLTGPLDSSAPVTTALISAIEPKLPPFRGD